jgi:hypothetical protein
MLWRRIPPWSLDRDGEPDSSNFVDKERGQLSVSLAPPMEQRRARANALVTLLAGHNGFGVVEFCAGDVRRLGDPPGWYVVRGAPLPDDPYHTIICPKLSRGDARILRDASAWVQHPNT